MAQGLAFFGKIRYNRPKSAAWPTRVIPPSAMLHIEWGRSAVIATKEMLRKRLEEERARLLSELSQLSIGGSGATEDMIGEHAGYGNHLADDATEIFEQERNLALRRNLQNLLAMTEHALHKFDAGTYGRCDECGGSIDPARLEALPWASLCIRCKARQERR